MSQMREKTYPNRRNELNIAKRQDSSVNRFICYRQTVLKFAFKALERGDSHHPHSIDGMDRKAHHRQGQTILQPRSLDEKM